MFNQKSYILGSKRSPIRELFEYGRQRIAEVGKDSVCDFSLGNPSVPTPKELDDALVYEIRNDESLYVHGYTSAAGCDEIRQAIASSLSKTYGLDVFARNIYITCGAAAALTSVFGALTADENSEFVAIAPFFPEYRCFSQVLGGKFNVVPADEKKFQIDFDSLEKAINKNTQGVIVNSPNNPSGTVYTLETIKKLAALLDNKSKAYGKPIYIISDEPYRELVYGGKAVPFIPCYYDNTIVCYSYSKKLSIPGERLGYVYIPEKATDSKMLFDAVAGTARLFGYVCAPSAMQKALAKCVDVQPDLTVYGRNRKLLYDALSNMGYFCAEPDGAFYLFVKAPYGDGAEFAEQCKKKDVLVVDGAGFGCPSFVRLSYCVDTDACERSLKAFEEIIQKK